MPTMEPPPPAIMWGIASLQAMKWDLIKYGLAAVPVGLGDVHELVVGMPAGVVDEGVDAAKATEGGLNHVLAAGHGANVGVDVGGAAAGGCDLGFNSIAAGRR